MSRVRATAAVLVALIGLYLSVPEAGLAAVIDAVAVADPALLGPAVLGLAGAFIGRVVRFQVILGPARPRWFDQVVASGIGFFALQALPFRLGEFVRPHLLSHRGVTWGRSLGALAVERWLDLLTLVGMLGLVGLVDLPAALVMGGVDVLATAQQAALAAVGIGVVALLALRFADGAVVRLLGRVPWIGARLAALVAHGRATLTHMTGGRLFAAAALSAGIWSCNVGTVWAFLHALPGLPTTVGAALTVCTATIAGVLAVPTPGMVGSFEWFATAALDLWSAPGGEAAAMALLWHAAVVGLHGVLGSSLLLQQGLRLGDVVRDSRHMSGGAG